MRRKDREMDRDFAYELIDNSDFGVLSMAMDNQSYGVPLSIVREGDYLYFHSAKSGKKIEFLKENNRVSVVFIGPVKIPNNYTYDELDQLVESPGGVGKIISSVFTKEFSSAMVEGIVKEIFGKEAIHAMKLICEKFVPDKMKYFDKAIEAGLKRTSVFSIKIEDIKGKRKKYDAEGIEMKWGRMD